MGFKKGRAARAAANATASSATQSASDATVVDSLKIWNDGGSCAYYTAPNGSEYKIDVATMEQTNVSKGSRRMVHRKQVQDKAWTMWQYEASRPQRHYCERQSGAPSNIAYMQYPKWVQFALDDRWKHFQHIQSASGRESVTRQATLEAWTRVVSKLDESTFASIFQISETPTSQQSESLLDCSDGLSALDTENNLSGDYVKLQLVGLAAADTTLQEVVFQRLVNSQIPPVALADAIRWLLRRGFDASAAHCRQIALSCGSLAALRVLIVEAKVDVYGLDLLETGPSSSGKLASAGHGGWIQRCKHAVKVLLARGAVLRDEGSVTTMARVARSKLLKRLESDGDILWARRMLDAMGEVFPEFVIQQLGKFLGVSFF